MTMNQSVLNLLKQVDDHVHDHESNHAHDHDHDHDHDRDGTGVMTAKISAMVVLFAASSLCGCVPFLLQRFFKWNNTDTHASIWVKCLLYFGGGVLLCTTFLHLLPEVQEAVEQLTKCGQLPKLTFPLAELLMCVGFFLMYLVEESIHTFLHASKSSEVSAFERGHSIRQSSLLNGKQGPLEKNVILPEIDVAIITPQQQQPHHQHHHHFHHHHLQHQQQPPARAECDNSGEDLLNSSLRGLFIVLALSIHELFEGMAIGLEHSANTVWFMFGAVSAHKLVLAFCVGVELIVARTRLMLSIFYILTFAIVSPIGIGIGILVSASAGASASSHSVVSVFLQGLACGTLLYVVFFEILSKNYAGLWAVFGLIAGFLVMFGLQQIGAANHNHSHGDCAASETSQVKSVVTENGSPQAFEDQIRLLREASARLLQQPGDHTQANGHT